MATWPKYSNTAWHKHNNNFLKILVLLILVRCIYTPLTILPLKSVTGIVLHPHHQDAQTVFLTQETLVYKHAIYIDIETHTLTRTYTGTG